jgi:hypothetical protein
MKREIIDLSCPTLRPLLGKDRTVYSQELYVKNIEELERNYEQKLLELFKMFNISTSVKSIPSSLPYKNELLFTLIGGSFLNAPYNFSKVQRRIMKEILDKDIYQLRFYLNINIITDGVYGFLEYRFRYYPNYTKSENDFYFG